MRTLNIAVLPLGEALATPPGTFPEGEMCPWHESHPRSLQCDRFMGSVAAFYAENRETA
jgi:hypothetical protein